MKILRFPFNSKPTMPDQKARELTRSFLDGSTSPDEEKQLYAYYSRRSIDPELERYRQMFAWYVELEKQAEPLKTNARRRKWIASAAAVAVLALTGVGLVIGSQAGEMSESRLYAGSYIIRNGQKITDIKAILPELRDADRIVDSTLVANRQVSAETLELTIFNDAIKNIADPEVKAMLLADLN